MAEVVYIRNTRPNAVLLRPTGVKAPITVERRGSREDTTAIPSDWLSDPAIASSLNKGLIEKISKEAFMALGERSEGRPAFALKQNAKEVALPHSGETSAQPFVLEAKVIDESRELRSPHPEFAETVPTTAEEMATGIRQPLPPKDKPFVPTSKEEKLERQIEDQAKSIATLTSLVETLVANQQDKGSEDSADEVEPKKSTRSGTKSKRTNTKNS